MDTKQKLEMIVEKANKLRDFYFEKHVAQIGLNFKVTRQEDGSWLTEFGIPDTKERDAFLLTFRLFYQENEPISFPNLHALLIDPSLSDYYRNQVVTLRKAYFDYIDGYSDYTVELFEGHPTRKQMIDVGLYGGLAHTNRSDRIEQFRIWTSDDIRANVFEQEFTRYMIKILIMVYRLADLSQTELDHNPALR
jgi:hypothetical protein